MKENIEIIETLSKIERVKRGNISANVRTEMGNVTGIEVGVLSDLETGNQIASFSQWQGSGLSVQFDTPDCDMVAILTEINTFINDIKD
ncbi:MAG: hypothetical protein K2M13_11010 [Muribaculaceae bacterium]|nr:hypothetical protein [Muribaculaceae bacterium]